MNEKNKLDNCIYFVKLIIFVQTRFKEMITHVRKQFELHENESKQFNEQTHAFEMVHAQCERFTYIYQAQCATNNKHS